MAKAATHKHAGSYLWIDTALPAQPILDLAVQLTPEVYHKPRKPAGPLVVSSRDETEMQAVLRRRKGVALRFQLRASSEPTGRTSVRSEILAFSTLQSTTNGIRTGQKRLMGWFEYLAFMEVVEALVKAQDPTAASGIVMAAG